MPRPRRRSPQVPAESPVPPADAAPIPAEPSTPGPGSGPGPEPGPEPGLDPESSTAAPASPALSADTEPNRTSEPASTAAPENADSTSSPTTASAAAPESSDAPTTAEPAPAAVTVEDATSPGSTSESASPTEAAAPTPLPTATRPLELKLILESLLFAAQKALTPRELREFLSTAAQDETAPEAAAFKRTKEDDIVAALEVLQQEHEAAGRTYRLLCVAGSWQFASVPEYAPWLRALLGRKARPPRLSQPGIETLTIIAYRQPVTRAEIEQIRGVNIDGVMQTLLERGLIVAVGRAEVVGRPVTYGTTPQFLEYFGIRALEDLPAADELRRIPVQRPESLLTVDPNLATAPADATPPSELPLAPGASPAGSPATSESSAPTPTTPSTDPSPPATAS